MNNFVKRFGGDVFSKMYPAARAYRESAFQYFFKSVVEASPEVLVWLQAHHYKKWMRCAFNPDIKCDYITSNFFFLEHAGDLRINILRRRWVRTPKEQHKFRFFA